MSENRNFSPNNKKLSIAAQLDDLFRYSDCLISIEEQSLIDLINKCEENRLQWLLTRNQLKECNNKLTKLEEENHILKADVKRLKQGFAAELQKRENFKKQSINLRKQLNSIKEFILKTDQQNDETRDKVLSYIHLETIDEEHDSEISVEGLEYDTTGEDILDEMNQSFISRKNLNQKQNDSKTRRKNQM